MPAPVIPGIATASRIAYTAHSRRGEAEVLPVASNAETDPNAELLKVPSLRKESSTDSTTSSQADSTYSQADSGVSSSSSLSSQEHIDEGKKDSTIVTTDSINSADSTDSDTNEDDLRPITSQSTRPVALFPQYLTPHATKITMVEAPLPHRGSTFSILDVKDTELLRVRRGNLSFSERRFIVDASTDKDIMCIRQDVGKLPRSYRFDDPDETKILDLQGNFFNLVKGPKSTALFTNALDQKPARLHMQGSFKRRHASIKDLDTDEVLVSMSSEIWNARSLSGRRTYEVEIAAGVDIVLIVGMIVALDARGSFVGPGQMT